MSSWRFKVATAFLIGKTGKILDSLDWSSLSVDEETVLNRYFSPAGVWDGTELELDDARKTSHLWPNDLRLEFEDALEADRRTSELKSFEEDNLTY